jgi:putative membrane protein
MFAAAPGAFAQVTSSQDSADSPWPTAGRDAGFGDGSDSTSIREALRGNFTEIRLGRMAEVRASESTVGDFARRMIAEHSSMYEQWGKLARKSRMSTDTELDPDSEQAAQRLGGLSGSAFDQAYMSEMIRLHERDLAALERMRSSARSPEVQQLADNYVPVVREHLAQARQVGSQVGVATTAGRAGGVTNRDDRYDRTDRSERNERNERNDVKDRPPLPAEDRAFVREVVGDHLMHIRLAKRAQREGQREATRELAERIEKEFSDWEERWEKLADRRDLEVPSHLERADRRKLERLDDARKRGFDRTYATMVANHLESVVRNFREDGQKAKSLAVRGMVERELPVIRELLARARRLERQEDQRREDSDRK